MRPWILGWGKECEVVAPANLRESILAELDDTAAAYGRRAEQRVDRRLIPARELG